MSEYHRVFKYDKKTKKIVQVSGPPRTVSPSGNPIPYANDAYSKRPVESVALGVHPSQVNDMRERVREAGASQGCHVRNDGSVVFTSRKARKQVMRHVGFHDNSGGYGDG